MKTQKPKRQTNALYGVLLLLLGLLCYALSGTLGGSHMQDFASGVLMGLSVAVMLVGIVLLIKIRIQK